MSWGDQVLDELGLVDIEHRESRTKMDKPTLMLYVFAMWFAAKHKIEIDEKKLEKEIEEFLQMAEDKDEKKV